MKTTSGYMRAPWEFELRPVVLPDTPPAGQVLVRVEACGICGTDLSAAVKAKDWQPFGHEVAGVIEQIGPAVEHLAVGQKVVLETSSFCGHCAECRNGRVDLCNKAPTFWGKAAMGFSDRMLAPACCVVPYDGLSADVASLVEPAGVAYDMVKTAAITLGDRVALIGPGPIALMAIPLLLRSGARQVVCIGRSHSRRRLEVARALGAEAVAIDGPLAGRTDLHRQFRHVLVTAPVDLIAPALDFLAYGGELTYIGAGTGSGAISFDANDFHCRKLQLRSSFASPALYFPVVIDLLKAGIIPGELILSHRFMLSDLTAAMYLCRDDKENAVKVVVNP
ncbi:MAG: alcohol dehydrogenase catalytic domain-containing protein [Methylacidiphilales bacterium]|nr:alcohol dehydrogenase catalytic domain-containing protein [Candidatus Methylacidiphilales bacterium]